MLTFSGNECIYFAQIFQENLNSSCQFVQLPSNPRNEWVELAFQPKANEWVMHEIIAC